MLDWLAWGLFGALLATDKPRQRRAKIKQGEEYLRQQQSLYDPEKEKEGKIKEASWNLRKIHMVNALDVPTNTLYGYATMAVPMQLFYYELTTTAQGSYRGWNPINYYELHGKRRFAPADYVLKEVGMNVDQFMIYMTNMTCQNITQRYWTFEGRYYAEHEFCGTYDRHVQEHRFGGAKQILVELLPNQYMLDHPNEFKKHVTTEDVEKNSLASTFALIEDSYKILDPGMPLYEFLGTQDRDKIFTKAFGTDKWKDYID
ncbi:hypothetical protein [Butyricicoccus intestinisimiae]|uniref:DUF3137 domain-containing protein n=1 Tax=Butyricicoccus intestinisimiae TaxID=2841509 RepID=A0ABS6EV96_9FIRM|nr:hypothetical protein [Butyricicoccus intestinisimiae]MBU5491375.1 hypothetical protein [Butyricicoccus intestinisimiae]